ncbi:MAG: aspartate carbamoyltransferase catalytic subunit [Candidatus Geothermincolia bacterium]
MIRPRNLLDVDQLSAEQMSWILETARSFEEVGTRAIKKVPALRGKTVVNLFFEPSTRTRMSFEVAAKRLSADVLNFTAASSSTAKGEGLKDTVKTLEAMGVDAIVMRHAMAGAPHLVTRWVEPHVINAGDGMHAHPTQALLDLYSLLKVKGHIEGLHVTIVGDIAHSRVARSDIQAFQAMGAAVTLIAPPTLLPAGIESYGAALGHDLDSVIGDTDVLYMLRLQKERQQEGLLPDLKEYSEFFGLNRRRLARARADVVIMHPGPMNRGLEIDAAVADDPRAIVTDQVANGVAVRMAVLFMMLGGEE